MQPDDTTRSTELRRPAFRRVALVGKQAPEIARSLRALRDFLKWGARMRRLERQRSE